MRLPLKLRKLMRNICKHYRMTARKVNLSNMQKNLEKKAKPDIAKRRRSLTRLMAVQIFYQFEFYDKKIPLNEIKNSTIEDYLLDENENSTSYHDKIDMVFLDNLTNSMVIDFANIDQEISSLLQHDWTIAKISRLLLQILRFATLELKSSRDISFKIIIDEYIDISSHFFENSRTSFVNSILENLAKKFRKEEIS
jgi:N utilization substance protein B